MHLDYYFNYFMTFTFEIIVQVTLITLMKKQIFLSEIFREVYKIYVLFRKLKLSVIRRTKLLGIPMSFELLRIMIVNTIYKYTVT